MPLILPDHYPFKKYLQDNQFTIKSDEIPTNQKVLNIGILNIMPSAEKYEVNILNSIGQFDDKLIKPHWIKLNQHKYGSTDKIHLKTFYQNFEQTIQASSLNGLIVTGAPVEHLPYAGINYWDELKEIMQAARNAKTPQVGLCWAGLAVAELLEIEKYVYPYKLFGVFESNYQNSFIAQNGSSRFYCPQSRHAGIKDEVMLEAERDRKVILHAHSKDAGYFIFESTDGLMLAHAGHSEYHKKRIADEYRRDKLRGREDVKEPANFNVDNPVNIWKNHRRAFFRYWLNKIN